MGEGPVSGTLFLPPASLECLCCGKRGHAWNSFILRIPLFWPIPFIYSEASYMNNDTTGSTSTGRPDWQLSALNFLALIHPCTLFKQSLVLTGRLYCIITYSVTHTFYIYFTERLSKSKRVWTGVNKVEVAIPNLRGWCPLRHLNINTPEISADPGCRRSHWWQEAD